MYFLRRHFSVVLLALWLSSASFSSSRVKSQTDSRAARTSASAAAKNQNAAQRAAIQRAKAQRRLSQQRLSQTSGFQWRKWRPFVTRYRIYVALGAASIVFVALASMSAARRKKAVLPESQWNSRQGDDEELVRLRTLLEFERTRQREMEDLYWNMAMNATDVLYIMHPTEGTVDWFGQIDTMLGYTKNSFPRTIEAWAEAIHPDESEKIIEMYTRSCKGGEDFRVEYKMRHRNGAYRDWQHRGRPVFDKGGSLRSFIGACTDVTDRNRSQKRLRESEERLSRILETNADAVVMCDAVGAITFVNRAAELLFGTSRENLLKSKYNDGTWKITATGGEELAPEQMPFGRVLDSMQPVSDIEHAIEQPSGKVVVVSVNAAPLLDGNETLSGAVLSITDVTGRKQLEERLSWQAFHDALTHLPNRALFMDRLTHALIRGARSQTSVAVFFIDLDNFKKINDTLGHDAGDELLKTTAHRLLEALRSSDTAARLGGDEFVLLLENISEIGQAKIVADRVLASLLQPVVLNGQSVKAPPSIGVSLCTPGCTPDELLKQADQAMYKAKQNGKGRYEFAESVQIDERQLAEPAPLRKVV